MYYKYIIQKDEKTGDLSIKEYSDSEKDTRVEMFKGAWEQDVIEDAVKGGNSMVIDTLRSIDFFPTGLYIEKIADAVVSIYNSNTAKDQTITLEFNDSDFLESKKPDEEAKSKNKEADEPQAELEGLDQLLSTDDAATVKDDTVKPT